MPTPDPAMIAKEWAGFERVIAPPDAIELFQRQDLRRTFYAGWMSAMTSIMAMLEDGDEPTDNELSQMDAIVAELDAFQRDMAAGKA